MPRKAFAALVAVCLLLASLPAHAQEPPAETTTYHAWVITLDDEAPFGRVWLQCIYAGDVYVGRAYLVLPPDAPAPEELDHRGVVFTLDGPPVEMFALGDRLTPETVQVVGAAAGEIQALDEGTVVMAVEGWMVPQTGAAVLTLAVGEGSYVLLEELYVGRQMECLYDAQTMTVLLLWGANG